MLLYIETLQRLATRKLLIFKNKLCSIPTQLVYFMNEKFDKVRFSVVRHSFKLKLCDELAFQSTPSACHPFNSSMEFVAIIEMFVLDVSRIKTGW